MIHINDIEKNTNEMGLYKVDTNISIINTTISDYIDDYSLDLSPDFQRGHVWNEKQRTKYMEFILRGGLPTPLKFNDPSINHTYDGDYNSFVIVDGLQRLTTYMLFNDNKVKAFGHYKDNIEGVDIYLKRKYIPIIINDLKSKKEVIKWYLEMNTGGTPHSSLEISRVKLILEGLN